MSYRFVAHTADVLVEIRAATFGELLTDCVSVVRDLAAGNSPVAARERREIAVTGDQPQEVVLNFVRELLGGFAGEAFIPANFHPTRADPRAASGVIAGERFDPARHAAQPEVKALTRHRLVVRETPEGWRAELLFDV